MGKLAVVTHTRHIRPQWLAECVESVRRTLPEYARHHVLDGRVEFIAARWDALQMAEFVAFVDDDDRLTETSALDMCMRALQATGAGMAFTLEEQIDETGRVVAPAPPHAPRLDLRDIGKGPRVAHHLCVIRREALSDKVIEAARRFGTGIEWFAKAHAAAVGGAVQVPVVGYQWRQHPRSLSKQPYEAHKIAAHLPEMRQVIQSWFTRSGAVPQHLPQ